MKPFVLLIATAMLCAIELRAQNVYFAVVSLQDSRATLSGFLHSVTDSSVIVIPGHRKKDVARIGFMQPVPIPIKDIKSVVAWKVQGNGSMLLQVAAMAALSTSTTFLAVEQFGPKWGLPSSFLANTAVIFAHTQLITRRLSPSDFFFREKIEDRCIFKDERSLIAALNPQQVVR